MSKCFTMTLCVSVISIWANFAYSDTAIVLTTEISEGNRLEVGQLVIELAPRNLFGAQRRLLLTPQGYQLPVDEISNGPIRLSSPPSLAGGITIFNTISNCSGTYYVGTETILDSIHLQGYIVRILNVAGTDPVFRVNWNTAGQSFVAAALINGSGQCEEIFIPSEEFGVEAEEFNPADIGFQESATEPYYWLLESFDWEVRHSDGIFCSGFESCPLQ